MDGLVCKEPYRSPVQPSMDARVAPESLFGLAYEFSSPNNAFLYAMFWTHLILLQPLIRRANSLLRPQSVSTTAIKPSSPYGNLNSVHPERYADKVARAMSYCLQDCMKTSFTKLAAFALCMISLNYVDTGNREKHAWCLEAIRSIAHRGFDVSFHLSKLMDAQWERRWGVGDPNLRVSLREYDLRACDANADPFVNSRGGIEDDSPVSFIEICD